MPIQGFNTGKDITLTLVGPLGVVNISGITGFQSEQMTQALDHKALDGTNKYAEIPTGWNGTFDLDRTDASVDSFFAQVEAIYYAGGDPGVVTIAEIITENGNYVSEWRYDGCALKFTDAGTWRGDQKVQQKIAFRATRRVQVA